MNYIILNNKEYFQGKINLKNFKEVDVNGSDRIDAVFCEITSEILERIDNNTTRRDEFFEKQWILRDPGVSFILSKIDRDILLNENTELIETLFKLFDKESFYFEIWGFNIPESYNQIDQFVIIYNKNFGYIGDIYPKEIKKDVLEELLKNVEEKIL